MVILRICEDRDETRKSMRLDVAEQHRGRYSGSQTGTSHEDGEQHPQRIHQEMPLAPLAFLAAILPALGAPDRGGLDRWALNARGTGGGSRPAATRGRSRKALTRLAQVPSSRHWAKES